MHLSGLIPIILIGLMAFLKRHDDPTGRVERSLTENKTLDLGPMRGSQIELLAPALLHLHKKEPE